ncbi:MAG: hypothetical protein EXR50_04405 [Dehalococcoidia bacterium]|nr:hypothetical protein [Dehalococcoidia bacterium]
MRLLKRSALHLLHALTAAMFLSSLVACNIPAVSSSNSAPATDVGSGIDAAPHETLPDAYKNHAVIRGLVTHIEAEYSDEIRVLTIHDTNSRVMTFTARGPINISPAHLRRHLVSSQPVSVAYTVERGKLIAVHVSD